ncbi:MAG: enoyl-CoA hydratase [Gammaproteobacteria bacterium]|nr:MAG: enoyl-CoA hydratase [Gammaproteobacteria bacterium]
MATVKLIDPLPAAARGHTLPELGEYSQLDLYYEAELRLHWCRLHPKPQPCFNPTILAELNRLHAALKDLNGEGASPDAPVRFQVLASSLPGVFNLGGDLRLFKRLIEAGDRATLRRYAYACIEAIHHSVTLHHHGITQIALVQGDALGGGFEGALSAQVLIAERSSKLGLPEVLFNLFPGMGAYSLLSRRIGPAAAERMILSGRLYGAEELYEMGVVDVLAEDGQGELAVYDYVQKENRNRNAIQALRRVRDRCQPVTWEELRDIVEIWVEAALKLTDRDLRMMERLVGRQSRAKAG